MLGPTEGRSGLFRDQNLQPGRASCSRSLADRTAQ